jgi:hypothetical protein
MQRYAEVIGPWLFEKDWEVEVEEDEETVDIDADSNLYELESPMDILD